MQRPGSRESGLLLVLLLRPTARYDSAAIRVLGACMRRLSVLLFCLVLGSCVLPTNGPAFTEAMPREDKALVYIYRSATPALGLRNAAFWLDDKKFADLLPTDYTFIYVTAGHHRLKQSWPYWPGDMGTITDDITISIDVRAGQTYYVRFSTHSSMVSYNATQIEWVLQGVPPRTGRSELPGTHFQPSDPKLTDSF